MKILFTKKDLDKTLINKYLGEEFSYDFKEMIRINPFRVEPFDLKNYSLIFSSINAVEAFFESKFQPNENFTQPNFNKIYCVGQKTKRAVRKHGFGTYKVKKHAKELAEFIAENSHQEKFLHFCGDLALDILDKTLPLQNIYYKKVVVYNTELLNPLVEKAYDALVFFSPSGVRSFVVQNSLEGKKLFSIGHTTEKELRKHTKSPIYTSQESTFEDILRLIVTFR